MADTDMVDIYAQHQALYGRVQVPDHVPPELVTDFDYLHPAGMEEGDVYTAWKRLHDGPDIVWTPCNGGHWIVTRGEDIRFVQENFEIFSHEVFTIPRGSSPIRMPPLTVDPPLHARYRAILNPFFTPSRVSRMREDAVALTRNLIEQIKPQGKCEFVNDFARVMPVTMFLGIVDLPLDQREQFVEWGVTFMTATDSKVKLGAQEKVVAYLQKVLDERAANPGDDLLSRIAGWRKNSRFQGDYEVIGMAVLVFFGGLDTVANMLSFITRYLAQNRHQRQRLIDEPAIIPKATEEFLRRFGLSNTGRLILRDLEYKGATFRKDEMVMVPISMSSMDDRLYDRPMEIDFDRNPEHNTFGNGPHKCVGSPLARAEIQVFLEEWLKAMPDFRLDPERPPVTHSGSVNGVDSLPLVWDV
ncbi:cytochrome P450 [Sphingobium chungbukense]|nr:cytochrome P450 [Sphingobium chungbukense]